MNRLLFYILGYYTIKLEGSNIKRLFKACVNKNLFFRNLFVENECILADVSRADYDSLLELCDKTSTNIVILQEHGIPAVLKTLRKQYYFVFLVCLICLIYYYMNSRLIEINISGNSSLSVETLINQLNLAGVSKYTNIKNIDCNELEELLIGKNQEIKWCSIYTHGNYLYVLIDEEIPKEQMTEEGSKYCSRVYGTVKNIYVRSGYSLLKPGDIVIPGDILVTGEIPITNAYEEVLDTRYVTPDCDITIEFTAESQIIQPYKSTVRVYNGEVSKGFEISLIDNKLFSYLPSISYETCDIITENADLKIMDFTFPISLKTYRVYNVSLQDVNYSYEESELMLIEKYEKVKDSYISAGYTILNEECNLISTSDCLILNYKINAEGPAYYID